jgi:hypothetical protein
MRAVERNGPKDIHGLSSEAILFDANHEETILRTWWAGGSVGPGYVALLELFPAFHLLLAVSTFRSGMSSGVRNIMKHISPRYYFVFKLEQLFSRPS